MCIFLVKTERKKNRGPINGFGKSVWSLRFVLKFDKSERKGERGTRITCENAPSFHHAARVIPLLLFQPLGGKKIEDNQRDTTRHEHACKID
jgi:hypothetical protein